MHRSGRIGRDILNVDRCVVTDLAIAVMNALLQDLCDNLVPDGVTQFEIDEAGTGNIDRNNVTGARQPLCNNVSDVAWFHPGLLGQDHGCIGGNVTV